jgi:4-nitrophenyl phosphatase
MLKSRFTKYENFIFDLDGTVWRWTKLVEGVIKVFQILYNLGKNIFFITNNTLLTREGFARKLQNFGINAKAEQIINPSLVAPKLCKGKIVYCLGEGIVTELRKHKITVSTSKADVVLISEDRTVTYDKFVKACEFVQKGAKFYKTAKGGVFIYGDKRLPGTGAIAKVVEMATGKEAELIGKPSKHMVKVLEEFKLDPEKTILFGDECNSDIALGNLLGFTTVLVLTGRDSEKDWLTARSTCEPKMILKSIAEIV